jgi:hypothetical protein
MMITHRTYALVNMSAKCAIADPGGTASGRVPDTRLEAVSHEIAPPPDRDMCRQPRPSRCHAKQPRDEEG